MKFALLILTLCALALPACHAPPGCPEVSAVSNDAALPAPAVQADLPSFALQAHDGVALMAPATVSQAALPWVFCDLQAPHADQMPGDVQARHDKAALARLRPTVHVSSALLHGWQRSSPRHC